jgi:hypothetical protein
MLQDAPGPCGPIYSKRGVLLTKDPTHAQQHSLVQSAKTAGSKWCAGANHEPSCLRVETYSLHQKKYICCININISFLYKGDKLGSNFTKSAMD